MVYKYCFIITLASLFLLSTIPLCCSYFNINKDGDSCFCQLQGIIDDCSCNVDTVDYLNNVKIYPRLRSLLTKDYFRFYKVNLKRNCPFWSDDSRCAIQYCHVEACDEHDIPPGLKGSPNNVINYGKEKYLLDGRCEKDHNDELSYLNTTISEKFQGDFERWKAYDDALDNFCIIDEADNDAEYVDLLLNPERYTGYKGRSAHRIWHSIYMENCFKPEGKLNLYMESNIINKMCLEKRVFYRVISGLHASINIHLCAKYLLSESNRISLTSSNGVWGPNMEEFKRRFAAETTNDQGPNWLRNLYFVYLLELRALVKASPYLRKEEYFTGNECGDFDTKLAIEDLLNVLEQFPDHFNESTMFNGGEKAKKLKHEFKQHFRNISTIMDCVGCDKCKLWGKLQVHGLGTALKILFSGMFDENNPEQYIHAQRKDFQLKRTEIVSLLNSIGRLSTSIYELDEFRKILR